MRSNITFRQKSLIFKKIIEAKFFKNYSPLIVSWAITYKCNLKCSYCDYPEMETTDLDTSGIIKIINQLKSCGTQKISLTGGEPLLRDDLKDIIDHIAQKDISVSLNSNGLLLEDSINKIKNISNVIVSLDGPENINSLSRPSNTANKIINSIKSCKNKNIKIMISTVLSKNNTANINEILKLAKDIGVPIIFQPAQIFKLGKNKPNPLSPDINLYRNCIHRIIQEKKSGNKYIFNSIAGLRHLTHWPDNHKIFCSAGKLTCRISPDGMLTNCPNFKSKSFDLTKIDVKTAFKSLNSVNCQKCWCATMVEFNLLSSFNYSALKNILQNM